MQVNKYDLAFAGITAVVTVLGYFLAGWVDYLVGPESLGARGAFIVALISTLCLVFSHDI